MTVVFDQKPPDMSRPSFTPLEIWYFRFYRLKVLVPLFPKDPEHARLWWYRVGFLATLFLAIWFYLLSLYFVYLFIAGKYDSYYLIGVFICLIVGIGLPAGIFRGIIFYLTLKKVIS